LISCKGTTGFLYQTIEAGKEQDSGETERERERESARDRALLEERDSNCNKINR
jgi:hypothetical protein